MNWRSLFTLVLVSFWTSGCESDYNLENETPVALDETSSPTPPVTSPGIFEPTPSMTPGTPEPGGWVSLLTVDPPAVDFGRMGLTCEASTTLTVTNEGTVTVQITNIRLFGESDAIDFDESDALAELGPGDSGTLEVSAEAIGVGLGELSLQIYSSEGVEPALEVPLRAEGANLAYPVSDRFFQEVNQDIDVLWVIDNSGSMSDDQLALAENFDAFMASFIPLGVDYHMGVVTTDMMNPAESGRMQGLYDDELHYITAAMREVGVDQFRTTIKTLGDSGSGTEQGLQAMEAALSTDNRFENQAAWNAGFLRPDAFLAVIFVSDEPDQSLPKDPQYYIDFLSTLKGGDLTQVVASAIIPCATNPVITGYAEVAKATGGVLAFICDRSYYEALAEVGWISAGLLATFPLSEVPSDPGAIEVTVGGVAVPQGETTWTYDEKLVAVVFSGEALPDDGEEIVINYGINGNCGSDTPSPGLRPHP